MMKSFVVTLLVGCSFVSLNAYGAPKNGARDERDAAINGATQPRFAHSQTVSANDYQLGDLLEGKKLGDLLEGKILPELSGNILKFMDLKDQQEFAHVSKGCLKAVLYYSGNKIVDF